MLCAGPRYSGLLQHCRGLSAVPDHVIILHSARRECWGRWVAAGLVSGCCAKLVLYRPVLVSACRPGTAGAVGSGGEVAAGLRRAHDRLRVVPPGHAGATHVAVSLIFARGELATSAMPGVRADHASGCLAGALAGQCHCHGAAVHGIDRACAM